MLTCPASYPCLSPSSLQQMTMGHPPNKYDFYHGHGIAVVADTLKVYRHDGDILLQGLGLLLNAVVDDPQTKVLEYKYSIYIREYSI